MRVLRFYRWRLKSKTNLEKLGTLGLFWLGWRRIWLFRFWWFCFFNHTLLSDKDGSDQRLGLSVLTEARSPHMAYIDSEFATGWRIKAFLLELLSFSCPLHTWGGCESNLGLHPSTRQWAELAGVVSRLYYRAFAGYFLSGASRQLRLKKGLELSESQFLPRLALEVL